ncbi:hypothetical protein U9M48_009581 [Paspalum notatum var. saurae]|uniref:Uncharacterized protein n=1 Tax=Paspalum notatum var. saurae TaxID=547442 RepID=A0AAQ3WF46_PASNO
MRERTGPLDELALYLVSFRSSGADLLTCAFLSLGPSHSGVVVLLLLQIGVPVGKKSTTRELALIRGAEDLPPTASRFPSAAEPRPRFRLVEI